MLSMLKPKLIRPDLFVQPHPSLRLTPCGFVNEEWGWKLLIRKLTIVARRRHRLLLNECFQRNISIFINSCGLSKNNALRAQRARYQYLKRTMKAESIVFKCEECGELEALYVSAVMKKLSIGGIKTENKNR